MQRNGEDGSLHLVIDYWPKARENGKVQHLDARATAANCRQMVEEFIVGHGGELPELPAEGDFGFV